MKTQKGLPLYQELMDKYQDKFETNCFPSFSNLLWQLIINGSWKDRNLHCFTPVLSICGGNGLMVGIAEQGEAGYHPTRVHLLTKSFDEAQKTLNELNEDMFELTPDEAFMIIATTMSGKVKQKAL